MSDNKSDFYHDPLINAARKALTPEQVEEYKKIGEYMYNNIDYKNISVGSSVKESSDEDLLNYASQALRSGVDPFDLSQPEIEVLVKTYGESWYDNFGFEKHEVPSLELKITPEQVLKAAEEKSKSMNLSRKQRRALERQIVKEKETISNMK